MPRTQQILQWMRDNPGWHFAGDILDGLGLVGATKRQPFACAVRDLAERGLVERRGIRKQTRYRLCQS